MRFRFKSILSIIFLLIIGCASIGIGYLFYTEVIEVADIVVDGDLTINYINGDSFTSKGNAKIEFSVTNSSSEQRYYYIQLSDVYANGITYILKSSNNLEVSNELKSDIISEQIAIQGNETINYTLEFISEDESEYSGKLTVGLKKTDSNTFFETILKNNKISETKLTNFMENATLNEGLIQSQDDTGIAYYFRGAISNNNVSFGDFNWKIVKINGDGSVKLVLDGIIEEIGKYYEEDYDFSNSEINKTLNSWYENYLKDYSDYIAYYKFCNDVNKESDGTTFIAYNRIITNKIPTYICLGNLINTKIGLLTIDEVAMAGASTFGNQDYYLYNESIKTDYYTMSSAKMSNNLYYPFIINTNGAITYETNGTLLRGIRPVINIIKTAKVEGLGTAEEPYKIIMETK